MGKAEMSLLTVKNDSLRSKSKSAILFVSQTSSTVLLYRTGLGRRKHFIGFVLYCCTYNLFISRDNLV